MRSANCSSGVAQLLQIHETISNCNSTVEYGVVLNIVRLIVYNYILYMGSAGIRWGLGSVIDWSCRMDLFGAMED